MTEKERAVNPIQVQEFLKGVDYPCTRKHLIMTAERAGADRSILDTLSRIPDRTYNGPTAVAEELGKLT